MRSGMKRCVVEGEKGGKKAVAAPPPPPSLVFNSSAHSTTTGEKTAALSLLPGPGSSVALLVLVPPLQCCGLSVALMLACGSAIVSTC